MVPLALIIVALSLPAVDQSRRWLPTLDSAGTGERVPSAVEDAQRFFYNGDYEKAAALTQVLCAEQPDDLEACELRTASLHFQIKKALSDTGERDRARAWSLCSTCPVLLSTFLAETARGRAVAHAKLATVPDDEDMLFFLGKVDLNYVWLQSGTLGRKTGWDEYWEARRSLDHVLRMNPGHVRARVARAWVDYIVGSTVPRGVRWLLGGGNKKRGLLAVREVAGAAAANSSIRLKRCSPSGTCRSGKATSRQLSRRRGCSRSTSPRTPS